MVISGKDPITGRSPRVRRNLATCGVTHHSGGSISARAEEPPPRCRAGRRGAVDLRACGGTPGRPTPEIVDGGRSPRVRRNPVVAADRSEGYGSISARAEEPRAQRRWPCRHRVDLRACGGTDFNERHLGLPWGRSPRVRRNRRVLRSAVALAGSISARAEEPRTYRSACAAPRVDLRACGGTGQLGGR